MKVYILLILCVLFWSGNFVIGRFVKEEISVFEMIFFRWSFTLILISPILFISYKKILNSFKINYKILLFLSFLGIALFNTLVYTGLKLTTATNALIINSSVPIIVLILSYFILKQSINMKQVFGIFISLIGVLYLILKGDILDIFSLEFNKGDLWIILSSFTWALYSVVIKFKPKDLSDIEFFSTIVFLGFIMVLPLYLYQEYSLEYELNLLKENYFVFIYISLFTSVLSYYFWHKGINEIGANKTAQFTHLMPIFGAILAFVFLGEILQSYHIIGGVFIALGIYLSLQKTKKRVSL